MDVVNWHPEVTAACHHLYYKTCSLPCLTRCDCKHWILSYASPCVKGLCTAVQDGFQIESTSGQIFSDVDLSDGEWVDYDEKLGESVGIMDLEHRFITHK